jgi:hypothetical protein
MGRAQQLHRLGDLRLKVRKERSSTLNESKTQLNEKTKKATTHSGLDRTLGFLMMCPSSRTQ